MRKFVFLLGLAIASVSCEDVVDVDLKEQEPQVIADALIRIDRSQALTEATIRLSYTGNFFGTVSPITEIQSMELRSADGGSVAYEPSPGQPGLFRPYVGPVVDNKIATDFLLDDGEYILYLNINDKLYLARTFFAPAVPIDRLEEGDGQLFDEDDKEVIITFTDDVARDDYYVFDMDYHEYITTEDQFFNGEQFSFSYFYDKDLRRGDVVTVSLLGADREFYNYINGLIEQSQQGGNGPFQTPTATVRGNFLLSTGINNIDRFNNVDRPEDTVLGFFALSEQYQEIVIIK